MRLARYVLALCVLPFAASAADGDVHAIASDFDTKFRSVIAEEEVPGAAYAIVKDGLVVRMGYTGQTEKRSGRAVNSETVFRIASVSKSFTATLAALLEREGRLSLNEPLARYLPEVQLEGARDAIGVDDVIGQSTGFVPHAYDNLVEAGLPREEIYRRFALLSPVCPPGTCYTYQNSVFSLIEPVLEKTAQASFPELVKERLFRPLHMASASIGYEAFRDTDNRAVPHVRKRRAWYPVPVQPNYYAVSSAAGVNASISDMSQWAIAALGHRPDVIPRSVLDEVMTPRVQTAREMRRRYWRDHLDDAHYGLGWRIYRFDGEELVYHGGWVSGFRAEITLSRARDLGLVVLMNAESSVIGELSSDFWSRAFRELRPTLTTDIRSTPVAGTNP